MFLREARVLAPSVKMSFGMGIRPCSNGSRRGWMYRGGFCGGGVEVEGESGSAIDWMDV